MEKQISLFNSDSNQAKHTKKNSWSLYVDGASRGNPGPAGIGIYINGGKDQIHKKGFFLGKKTNNQAEYCALACALFLLHKILKKEEIVIGHLDIYSDSELLIKQMNRIYKVRDTNLQLLKKVIDVQLHSFSYRFTHVRREQNTIADELANKGIDTKNALPTAFVTFIRTVIANDKT
jgi:ribonuclease HI